MEFQSINYTANPEKDAFFSHYLKFWCGNKKRLKIAEIDVSRWQKKFFLIKPLDKVLSNPS